MDFSGISILVVGDVMLDHYIIGEASRVSPEAPVPVLRKERAWTVPGGAANVARCLTRLGCQSRLVGLVGHDGAGETLRREIEAEGVRCSLVAAGRPTTCKTRIMAAGQQLLRVDEETAQAPALEEIVALRKHVEATFPDCSAVILSDYAKGTLMRCKNGESLCNDVIHLAADAGVPVLVDPKGTDWARYAGAQCVTPNMKEFANICEMLFGERLSLAKIAEENRLRQSLALAVREKFALDRLLLTRGAKGMSLFDIDGSSTHIRATMREVADVSGAGDTVIATLAACVAKGLRWEDSAKIANVAAGIAVGKLGTSPVNISELNHALQTEAANPKLFGWREIGEKILEWRRQGQKIVFTNGCFDLLHPGHISLLRQSAALGDKLVVGLNSDASVKRLKGPDRPVQAEENRAILLGALRDVDAVVIFDEDTPEKLIRHISPDYLVKGSDYKLKNVVGADYVLAHGGQVKLVDIVEGCSTTNIVRRMRGDEK